MRVLDLCAGAGGKTLQLAALMENRGEIIALDVVERKLTELQRRAQRAQVTIIRKEIWGPNTLRSLTAWADRVLIDAPCSGLGTLRRQPDLKWRLTAAAVEKARRTQKAMLEQYPELMRAGGKFVYATCSILPTENEGQVEGMMNEAPEWKLLETLKVSPAGTTSDGFYAAAISKG
jgi:16S rRNA (cytosine967-C5)-methyltransferase